MRFLIYAFLPLLALVISPYTEAQGVYLGPTNKQVRGTLQTVNGGTSLTAAAEDNVMVGNSTDWVAKLLPSCSNAATSKLLYDNTTNTFSCGTDQSGGGAAHNLLSATHSDTTTASAVRGDGVFAVGASPTWQRVAHSSATGGYFKWNGTDMVASALAAAGTGACGANLFTTALNGDAAPTCTQPAFTDISGSVTDAQVPNSITVDLATVATTANAGDSATAFFPSGTIETARLGSGTADATTFLRGDQTWQVPAGGGGALAAGHYVETVADGNTNEVVLTPGYNMRRREGEVDANGGNYTFDFDPTDPTIMWFREEFGAGGTTTGTIGSGGWNVTLIGAAPTLAYQVGTNPTLGVIRMTTTATSTQGGSITRGAVQNLGNLSANTNWDFVFRFTLGQTVTSRFRIGLLGAMNVAQPSDGIWLRYDTFTGFADAAFKVCVRAAAGAESCSGTTFTVNTSVHKIRMRSTTAGQVIFTFDANSDVTIASGLPTANMVAGWVLVTDSAATKFVEADFAAGKIRGLAR